MHCHIDLHDTFLSGLLCESVFVTQLCDADVIITDSKALPNYCTSTKPIIVVSVHGESDLKIRPKQITILVSPNKGESKNNICHEIISQMMSIGRSSLIPNNDYYRNIWCEGLVPYTQPIFSIESDDSVIFSHYEVLARYNLKKVISPSIIFNWASGSDIVTVFENLIIKAGHLLNISSLSFNLTLDAVGDEDLFSRIYESIINIDEEYRKFISIELTEQFSEHQRYNFDQLNGHLVKLNNLGVKVALDDFGVDSSNYDRIDALSERISVIKIDKSFINGLVTEDFNSDRIKYLTALMNSIPAINEFVFEGIETRQQLQACIKISSDLPLIKVMVQGYYLSCPEPIHLAGLNKPQKLIADI